MNVEPTCEQSAADRYTDRMRAVLDHIERNLDSDLSLDRLSEIAHFSRFHFHRQFSSYVGVSVASFVRILRLRRASLRLAFMPTMSITDIALEAHYQSTEAFSRAFRRLHTQTPSDFRRNPQWQSWQRQESTPTREDPMSINVSIVDFPKTRVAAVEYRGPEQQSLSATRQLIAWRRENGVPPGKGNTYGVHYSDPATASSDEFRMDICVSYDRNIPPNPHNVVDKTIPGGRCAVVRRIGSRDYIPEAEYLYREWLPMSGEELRDFPIFFHYVNVGPNVLPGDMVTDIYLPLR